MATDAVIVYHSQMEAERDAYWNAHPELVVKYMEIAFWVIVAAVIIGVVYNLYKRKKLKKSNFITFGW